MGYQVIRLAKRNSRSSTRSMLRHALREDHVPNALPGAPRPQVIAGCSTSGEALARLSAALKAAPRVQKNTVQALDFLVTGDAAVMHKLGREGQDAYFRAAADFLGRRFGGPENVLVAAIHRDESTPHMQVLLMPRDQPSGRFIGKRMVGGIQELRALHTDFNAEVASKFGLKRGEQRQDREKAVEHVPIRRFYAALQAGDRPLPAYMEVPAAPTLTQRALGQAAEIEAARKKAQEHNRRVRAELVARAKAASQIHPSQVARQAERYRQALRAEETAKRLAEEARQRSLEAENSLVAARADLVQAAGERAAVESVVQHVQTQSFLARCDEIGKNAGAGYVAKISAALGVELRPGRSLIDQVRKALGITGQGAGLQALQRLDDAAEGAGLDTLTNAALRAPGAASETVTPRHRG